MGLHLGGRKEHTCWGGEGGAPFTEGKTSAAPVLT